jgi:uncharacterized protein (TIRG00374 family)
MKKILQYLISLLIAGGLLYWVFKDIDLVALWAKIKQADYQWVIISAILALMAHWSRAFRWAMILEPLGYRPTTFRTTLAVLIGYLMNLVFPRAGEVARSASLQRLENVPFEKSFGAVVAERVIDVLVLLFLIFLNLLLEFERLSSFFFDFMGEKFKNPTTLLIVAFIGLVGVGAVIFLYKKFKNKIIALPLFQKITAFIGGLWSGFSSVLKLKKPSLFLFHTILIWTLYYLITYCLCLAIPETAHLSPLAILTILVMGSIGMAAPTVGGIGSYHILVGSIVVLYGLDKQNGYTLATFLHSMQGLFFVVVFGIIAFIISSFLKPRDSAIN